MTTTNLTSNMEDYLEAIMTLQEEQKVARVRDIARQLNVKMPSVTRAVRNLAEKGLVPVNPVVSIPAAEYTGSQIIAKSVMGGKDDSPDVPVTDATNVTESENSIFVDPSDNEFLLNSNT